VLPKTHHKQGRRALLGAPALKKSLGLHAKLPAKAACKLEQPPCTLWGSQPSPAWLRASAISSSRR